jgi:hypothetical protein
VRFEGGGPETPKASGRAASALAKTASRSAPLQDLLGLAPGFLLPLVIVRPFTFVLGDLAAQRRQPEFLQLVKPCSQSLNLTAQLFNRGTWIRAVATSCRGQRFLYSARETTADDDTSGPRNRKRPCKPSPIAVRAGDSNAQVPPLDQRARALADVAGTLEASDRAAAAPPC